MLLKKSWETCLTVEVVLRCEGSSALSTQVVTDPSHIHETYPSTGKIKASEWDGPPWNHDHDHLEVDWDHQEYHHMQLCPPPENILLQF